MKNRTAKSYMIANAGVQVDFLNIDNWMRYTMEHREEFTERAILVLLDHMTEEQSQLAMEEINSIYREIRERIERHMVVAQPGRGARPDDVGHRGRLGWKAD